MTCAIRLACAMAVVSILANSAMARADDQEIIDYRQHIMKTMGEQAAVIDAILQGKAPADNLATHVRILAITASTAKIAFEPNVPGGEAKPEVWAHWPDFAKQLDTLAAATDSLTKTAKDGGVAATAAKMQSALTCQNCHDTYRADKE